MVPIRERRQTGQIHRHFDLRAETYGETSTWTHQKRLGRIIDLLTIQRDAPSFVDVGAGIGTMRRPLLDRFPGARYVGVDLSLRMLQQADRGTSAYAQADAHALPLLSHSFDCVLARQVMHYLERPVDAILEFRRVLRADGGVLIIQGTPLSGDDASWWKSVMQVAQPVRQHRWTAAGLREVLRKGGFQTDVEITETVRIKLHDWLGYQGLDPRSIRLGRLLHQKAPASVKASRNFKELDDGDIEFDVFFTMLLATPHP
ncbi:class I SAM-dependent methyltransferase [Micromonospora sp. NPDC050276]|uniref:class I SAM-dependent methyltransferase n=1 Tax=Micromonospora sp. NPDC050276 TaxID=3364278 RepID=UPI00378C2995